MYIPFSSFKSWLRGVSSGSWRRAPIVTRAKKPKSYRPLLEALEDRTLPAVTLDAALTWLYTGDTVPFAATYTETGPLSIVPLPEMSAVLVA